ncbi:MAG: BofC C-terminal domain-containing protein [Defluviitaleaceae bacterium]|nr:BofC C-terminal domain-containing protein [Defluviitaleaceae bacterium]
MGKSKYFALICGTCVASALAGIALGYFVFGPIGVSARDGIAAAAYESDAGFIELAEAEPETVISDSEPAHNFIVTSRDGYIAVYYAGEETELRELTFTPVNALPPEEQERLAQGIHIYTEEALTRILEDYGS